MPAVHMTQSREGQDARSSRMVAGSPDRIIAFNGTVPVTVARFERHVRALATRLPSGDYAINLCEDRYRFLVAFWAVAHRGQGNLLPPSRARSVGSATRLRYPRALGTGEG